MRHHSDKSFHHLERGGGDHSLYGCMDMVVETFMFDELGARTRTRVGRERHGALDGVSGLADGWLERGSERRKGALERLQCCPLTSKPDVNGRAD